MKIVIFETEPREAAAFDALKQRAGARFDR